MSLVRRIVVFTCLVVTCISAPVFACSCRSSPQPVVTVRQGEEEKIGDRDVILEGKVERQEVQPNVFAPPGVIVSGSNSEVRRRLVVVSANRVYRGPPQPGLVIETGVGGGDCGFDFETGAEYLIFGDLLENGNISTGICDPTVSLDHAPPALLRLLRAQAPAPEDLMDIQTQHKLGSAQAGAEICGRVIGPNHEPLKGVSVGLIRLRQEPVFERVDAETESSRDGSFCLHTFDHGKFVIRAERIGKSRKSRLFGFYPGVTKFSLAARIELQGHERHRDLEIRLVSEPLFSVPIRVSSGDGSPLPGEMSLTFNEAAIAEGKGCDPDWSAGCTVEEIAPGQHILIVYLELEAKDDESGGRWYLMRQEVEVRDDSEIVVTMNLPKN